MKTQLNSNRNIAWNIKRMLYALQVIIIVMAIPLLSYMELTHVQKSENLPVTNSNPTISKPDVVALTFK